MKFCYDHEPPGIGKLPRFCDGGVLGPVGFTTADKSIMW